MVHLSDHHYEPQQSGDSRSPCPALNAMANHGYIHRDGRGITWWQLVAALREVYNLSFFLAAMLTTVGMLVCGSWFHPGTLNLHELSWHNRLEHDCSLAHADAKPGAKFAPNHSDRTLLCRLLTISAATTSSHALSAHDFALARVRRSLESHKSIFGPSILIAHGEAGLTLLAMGLLPENAEPACDIWLPVPRNFKNDTSRVVPREFVRTWFGYDRFPDGWERPKKTIGFFRTSFMSWFVEHEIGKIDPSLAHST